MLAPSPSQRQPHLDVPVGQQQVDDDVRGEQLHTVQAFLDASQFLAQVLATETLPGHADLLPDGLPEVLASVGVTEELRLWEKRFWNAERSR